MFDVFCVVTRRTPGSALFPYTTLFRSGDLLVPQGGGVPLDERPRPLGLVLARDAELQVVRRPAVGRHALLEDRKSTRLNSSHVETSYAVFCMKKQKTQSFLTSSPTGSR